MKKFIVKPSFGHFNVIDVNTKKMIVGYKKKGDAEKTAEGLNRTKTENVFQMVSKLKTTKGYGHYLK